MSRFTTIGWIALPFVIAIRAPFALATFILIYTAKGLDKVARLSIKGMNMMPTVKYRQEWVDSENERLRKLAIAEFTRGSQIDR